MIIILFFLLGCTVGIYQAFKPIEQETTENRTEPGEAKSDTPKYVFDELEILKTQKAINNDFIKQFEDELQYTFKTIDVLKLEKKINDLDIKNNKIDKKIEQLKEKYAIY